MRRMHSAKAYFSMTMHITLSSLLRDTVHSIAGIMAEIRYAVVRELMD